MATRTPTSPAELHVAQAALAVRALKDGRRFRFRGIRRVIKLIWDYQTQAVDLTVRSAPAIIRSQGIDPYSANEVIAEALLTEQTALTEMLRKIERDSADLLRGLQTDPAFDRLVQTLIHDAARTATQVDAAARPAVTAFVRVVGPACCGRCAVLAGKVYKYSTGFQRHENCGCSMIPTTIVKGDKLLENPADLFRQGRITGLSRADTRALNEGADISRVVNVRRKQAGLREGSSVMLRAGKPTPAFIYRLASDPEEVRRLMQRYGYLR